MSKCFNKECDYCKDNECRFGIEYNAGCHWYIGEPLKEPLSKKFQDYAEEELPKLREQIEQKDQRIAELEKEKQTAVKEFAEELIKMLNKYSIKRIIKICDNVLENNINLILRKRGIE